MVRERIKELIDFATTESPYRSANKGWIRDDVYVAWGGEPKVASIKPGNELANVSVFWKPINQILLILFSVVSLATVCVFLAVSISHGKLSLGNAFATEQIRSERVSIVPAKTGVSEERNVSDVVNLEEDDLIDRPDEERTNLIGNRPDLQSEMPPAEFDEIRSIPKEFVRSQPRKAITAVDLFQSKHS